ncbi:MAG TPA: hypothetical protein VGN17_00945 [Bryobacteraceae bacterium]|jgi:hypothetical protein
MRAIGSIFLAGLFTLPAWSDVRQSQPESGQPGAVNYVEGKASLGSQPLSMSSVGSAQVQAGQTLATQDGKAEMLLTPGVFLRTGPNSSVRMDQPGLANTSLTLVHGRAMVEVAEIHSENNITIRLGGADVRLTKRGLYDFDADHNQVRVFDGVAEAAVGGKTYHIHGGHQLDLSAAKLKARGFDKKFFEDDFYRWSSLRSSYLAEANVDAASLYYAGGPGWYGTGWYWDPWFSAYTWIPGDGFFYSPFGWGFYSPAFVYGAPGFYGGYGYRFGHGYGHVARSFGPGYRPPVAARSAGVSRGFATAPRISGGGFRGGSVGGGFRGGNMGGGFHGGMGGGFRGGGGRR